MTAVDFATVRELIAADHGLAVVSIATADRSVHSSVANVGLLEAPRSRRAVVGLVAGGRSRKLVLLREHPRATIALRAGWKWAAVEGPVDVIGPDDAHPDYDADGTRLLLRDIFRAAGGSHPDWNEYDQVMAEQRRAAVLLTPELMYANPTAAASGAQQR
jgi:hypothetical protein